MHYLMVTSARDVHLVGPFPSEDASEAWALSPENGYIGTDITTITVFIREVDKPFPVVSPSQGEERRVSRYTTAQHAMQSGVAYEMANGGKSTQPKHLRVGVNTALVDHASLATLLIEKGVITQTEYEECIATGMENEVKRLENKYNMRFA